MDEFHSIEIALPAELLASLEDTSDDDFEEQFEIISDDNFGLASAIEIDDSGIKIEQNTEPMDYVEIADEEDFNEANATKNNSIISSEDQEDSVRIQSTRRKRRAISSSLQEDSTKKLVSEAEKRGKLNKICKNSKELEKDTEKVGISSNKEPSESNNNEATKASDAQQKKKKRLAKELYELKVHGRTSNYFMSYDELPKDRKCRRRTMCTTQLMTEVMNRDEEIYKRNLRKCRKSESDYKKVAEFTRNSKKLPNNSQSKESASKLVVNPANLLSKNLEDYETFLTNFIKTSSKSTINATNLEQNSLNSLECSIDLTESTENLTEIRNSPEKSLEMSGKKSARMTRNSSNLNKTSRNVPEKPPNFSRNSEIFNGSSTNAAKNSHKISTSLVRLTKRSINSRQTSLKSSENSKSLEKNHETFNKNSTNFNENPGIGHEIHQNSTRTLSKPTRKSSNFNQKPQSSPSISSTIPQSTPLMIKSEPMSPQKSFGSPEKITVKIDPTTPKKPQSFECNRCQRTFPSYTAIRAHNAYRHRKRKQKTNFTFFQGKKSKDLHTCQFCGASVTLACIKLHLKRIQKLGVCSRKICPFCREPLSKFLDEHMEERHPKERNYCRFCNKRLSNWANCTAHMKLHHTDEYAEWRKSLWKPGQSRESRDGTIDQVDFHDAFVDKLLS